MITVLRLGHRVRRDKRVTTHCGLVSRALLADRFVLAGEEDNELLERLRSVSKKWGGTFKAKYEKDWKAFLKKEKKRGSVLIHLTFYGLPFQEQVASMRKKVGKKNLVIIVGAEKVPRELYALADFNLSVTLQPHSEIAALALFLDYWYGGKELGLAKQKRAFGNAVVRIVPQARGKKVLRVFG